jgi:hypothetical protein
MTSYRQIEANRRNALKSTGPRTEAGKQASRCNAVRHGLTAERRTKSRICTPDNCSCAPDKHEKGACSGPQNERPLKAAEFGVPLSKRSVPLSWSMWTGVRDPHKTGKLIPAQPNRRHRPQIVGGAGDFFQSPR